MTFQSNDSDRPCTRDGYNLSFNAAAEEFLATCLGGRVESVGDDLRGSSITVPTCGELLPALQAALEAPR